MSGDRARRAVLWFAWSVQVIGGVVGFGFFASQVFVGFDVDPLARQCLRLAVYSNLGGAVLALGVLLRARESTPLRWLAASGVVYHAPAGVDGWFAANGGLLLPPIYGPAVFHALMAGLLLVAVALPGDEQS